MAKPYLLRPRLVIENITWVWGTALALTAAIAPPFAQYDWPVPKGPQQPQYFTASFPIPLTLLGQTVTIDGPTYVTPPPQDYVSGMPATLAQPVAAPPPATVTFDWPNPRGSVPNISLLTWTDSAKLPPLVIPPATTVFDYPNPRGYTPATSLLTHTNWFALPLTIPPATVTFDYPNPRGYVPEISLRTWIDKAKPPLTAAKPFAYYDWPVPAGKKPVVLDWEDSFKLPLTTVKPPFTQYDWPIPKGAKPVVADWEDSFKLPLTTVKPPFTQYDWPVPKGGKSNPDWKDSFKLPLTTVRPPSIQRDWPVPRGPERGIRTGQDWSQRPSAALLYSVAIPVTLTFDYPNPVLRTPIRIGYEDSFKLPLTFSPPYTQYDWPVPGAAKPNQSLGHTGSGLSLTVSIPPPAPKDWPNPRGPQSAVTQLTWTDSFKLPLTTVRPPSIQYDWPVPRGAQRAITSYTWLGRFSIGLTSVAPPSQRFWGNPPLGAARAITLRTWTDRFKTEPPEIETATLGPAEEIAGPTFIRWSPPSQVTGTTVLQLENLTPFRPLSNVTFVRNAVLISTTGPNIALSGAPAAVIPPGDALYNNPTTVRRLHADFRGRNVALYFAPATVTPPGDALYANPAPRPYDLRDYIGRNLTLSLPVAPVEPIPDGKAAYEAPTLGVPAVIDFIGPNLALYFAPPPVEPPEPPIPEVALPPKHGHGRVKSGRSRTTLRSRKSRGTVKSSKSRTTPRDDP